MPHRFLTLIPALLLPGIPAALLIRAAKKPLGSKVVKEYKCSAFSDCHEGPVLFYECGYVDKDGCPIEQFHIRPLCQKCRDALVEECNGNIETYQLELYLKNPHIPKKDWGIAVRYEARLLKG